VGIYGVNKKGRGFSLIEALVSLAILAIVVVAALRAVANMRNAAEAEEDRAFAIQRSISLLEEVRSIAQQGEEQDWAGLDRLDDGVYYNPILTTQDVTEPGNPLSGNVSTSISDDGWMYSRRLLVRPFVGLDTRDVRIVTAMLYRNRPGGRHALLADVSTVLRTPGEAFPTTQTYDVYFLAVENIPGWWVYMSYIKPVLQATLTDLQARNPGLAFRAHWITKSSYGRDWRYMPFINQAVDSYQDIDWVYFYPGTMPTGESANEYYVPSQIRARMNVDGTERNGYDATAGPTYNIWPYSIADEYNQGMRYIDEMRYFHLRVAAGLEEETAPTWRILLERMCTDPGQFENAIYVNLHGELLPMPSIRNYSDAAKDPSDVNRRGVRAVTHPRYLRTPLGTDLQARVYAYRDPYEDLAVTDPRAVAEPITVTIKNVNLAGNVNGGVNPTLIIERVYGGVDGSAGLGQDGDLDPYGIGMAPLGAGSAGEMWARVTYTGGDTVIALYNTPLTCPYDGDNTSPSYRQGLPSQGQLYGVEYVPCSTDAAGDFSRSLAWAANQPKNTARWMITIPSSMYGTVSGELASPHDGVTEVVNRLTLETRIGTDLTTGVMWPPGDRNKPENLSRTYAWWTRDPEDVPFTERAQFIGDPRHCPYADLKDSAPVLSFQNGYNWWFDNFRNSSYNVMSWWPGYSTTRIENDEGSSADGWADYHWYIDVPRYLELLRIALINTDSLWTTLTGYSYFYMAIGNEIAYDTDNGFPRGIPVSRKPFYGTSGERTEQNLVEWATPTDASVIGDGMKLIKRGRNLSSGYWWGKNWLGELYPDDDWDTWEANGNLATGETASTYVRFKREGISYNLPRGTTFLNSKRCMREEGCNSFFMAGTRSSTFYHQYNDSNGTLTSAGAEVAADYAFPLPTYARINRPFRLDWSGSWGWDSNPDFDFTSDYPHNTATNIRTFYTHPWSSPNGKGSSLVALTNPASTHSSFQVINGLSQTIESGSPFIAKWALLSLVHSFLTAGEPDTASVAATRVVQLPRVEIRQPTLITELRDPDEITVQWATEFCRWDGEKYTQYYPDGFDEPTWLADLRYVLLYSDDTGKTWRYMIDDTEAELGERPDAMYVFADLDADDDEYYTWDVSDQVRFPEGSYLVRVETYRENKVSHYSQHMEKIYIDR